MKSHQPESDKIFRRQVGAVMNVAFILVTVARLCHLSNLLVLCVFSCMVRKVP